MKKILTIFVGIFVFLFSGVASAAVNGYGCTGLTGNCSGCLDALDITGATAPNADNLAEGDIAIVVTISGSTVNSYKYVFDASGTDAEDSPWIIRPDDYATQGVWRKSEYNVKSLTLQTGQSIIVGSTQWDSAAADTIDGDAIEDASIDASELATGSVDSAEIATGAVQAAEIDAGAVDSSEIATDAVNITHIDWGTGANQVSADDIGDGSTNAIVTLTQETNFGTAYTHSQDNTQAHSDYLLNTGADTLGVGGGFALTFNAGATDPVVTFGSDSVAWTNSATFTVDGAQVQTGTDDDVPESGDFGAGADLEADGSLSTGSVADNEIDYSAVTLGDFDYQGTWKLFYSNGLGDVTELGLGTNGQYLKSNGTGSIPGWGTPGGSGDITAVGPAYTSGAAFTDNVASTGTKMFVWEGTTDDDGNEFIVYAPSADPDGDINITFPATTDTLVGRATTDTLTNKTLTSPTITGPTFSGNIDFGTGDMDMGENEFEMPNDSDISGDTDTTGEIAIDTDGISAWDGAPLLTFRYGTGGGDVAYLLPFLTLPTDGANDEQCVTFEGTSGTFEFQDCGGAGSGIVESVGDCTTAACLDGTSDGGTYIAIYDGNSNYGKLDVPDIDATANYVLPDESGTIALTTDTVATATSWAGAPSNSSGAEANPGDGCPNGSALKRISTTGIGYCEDTQAELSDGTDVAVDHIEEGSAYEIIQMNSAGTETEWTGTLTVSSIHENVPIVDSGSVNDKLNITIDSGVGAKSFNVESDRFDFGSMHLFTTGVVLADMNVINKGGNATLVDDEMGGIVFATAAATITLPAVQIGRGVCVYSTTAALVSVNPNASDRIRYNGTPDSDGHQLDSASGAGDFVCLIGDSADGWTTLGLSGAWTAGS